jgi:hypothetical protein
MAKTLTQNDGDQQDPVQRNADLAALLNGPWANENIETITRTPTPTDPPDPKGPANGSWVATTV